MSNISCPCTTFEQNEDCPVGQPSLLCSACEGKGVASIESVVALAAEMLKVAEQVDELEDPFAAWESIELLKSAKPTSASAQIEPLWVESKTRDENNVGIGMAIAAAIIMRVWGHDVEAREIISAAGLTSEDRLRDVGVEDYDLDALRPILDETRAHLYNNEE